MYGRDPVCELEAWALQQIAQMQKQIIEQEKQLQDLTQQQKCIADLVHGEKEVAELILEEQKIQDALRKKRLQHAQSLRNCGGFPCIEKAEEVQDSHTSFGSFSGSPGLTPRTIDSDELQRTIDQQEPGLDANDLMPAPAKSLRPPPGLSRSGDEQCPITSTVSLHRSSVNSAHPDGTNSCPTQLHKLTPMLDASGDELKQANDENDENNDENDENHDENTHKRTHQHRRSGRARQREKKRILKAEAAPRSETI